MSSLLSSETCKRILLQRDIKVDFCKRKLRASDNTSSMLDADKGGERLDSLLIVIAIAGNDHICGSHHSSDVIILVGIWISVA